MCTGTADRFKKLLEERARTNDLLRERQAVRADVVKSQEPATPREMAPAEPETEPLPTK